MSTLWNSHPPASSTRLPAVPCAPDAAIRQDRNAHMRAAGLRSINCDQLINEDNFRFRLTRQVNLPKVVKY